METHPDQSWQTYIYIQVKQVEDDEDDEGEESNILLALIDSSPYIATSSPPPLVHVRACTL